MIGAQLCFNMHSPPERSRETERDEDSIVETDRKENGENEREKREIGKEIESKDSRTSEEIGPVRGMYPLTLKTLNPVAYAHVQSYEEEQEKKKGKRRETKVSIDETRRGGEKKRGS